MSRTITKAMRSAFESGFQQATIKVAAADDYFATGHTTTLQATLTNEDIFDNGLIVDRYCSTGDTLETGSTVSAQLTLTLLNNDTVSAISWNNTQLAVSVSAGSYTYDLGVFIVQEYSKQNKFVKVTALDKMILLDSLIGQTWDDFVDDHNLPAPGTTFGGMTLAWFLAWMLNLAGASDISPAYSSWSSEFPGYGQYSFLNEYIDDIPNMENITYRGIIQYALALAGKCAMYDNNTLVMQWYVDSSEWFGDNEPFTISPRNRFSGSVDVDLSYQVYGVGLSTPTGGTYYPPMQARMQNNFVRIQTGISIRHENTTGPTGGYIGAMLDKMRLSQYYLYDAEILSAPYLRPLDIIDWHDNSDESDTAKKCLVSHVTYRLNGKTAISGREKPNNDGVTDNTYNWNSSLTGQETNLLRNNLNKLESKLDGLIVKTGRATLTVTGSPSIATVDLSLGFTPTASTRIVASVLVASSPTPYNNAVLTLHYTSNKITASLTAGGNSGQTLNPLVNGTYYIDWIVLSQ